jgi:hypothetical protein
LRRAGVTRIRARGGLLLLLEAPGIKEQSGSGALDSFFTSVNLPTFPSPSPYSLPSLITHTAVPSLPFFLRHRLDPEGPEPILLGQTHHQTTITSLEITLRWGVVGVVMWGCWTAVGGGGRGGRGEGDAG